MFFAVVSIIALSFLMTGCGKKETPGKETVVKKEGRGTPFAFRKKAQETSSPQTTRPVPSTEPITEERVLFNFEKNLDGWEIPDWALEKDDHVASSIEVSKDFASEGSASGKVQCDFPGQKWAASVIELEQFLDFGPYRQISVDLYLPKDAPMGLKAKIILTVGDGWKFTEMAAAIPLVPGEWTTIAANIEPGSYDWKRTVPDESFRTDVRKIAVRIVSNKRPVYKGPVYIDNVRIGK